MRSWWHHDLFVFSHSFDVNGESLAGPLCELIFLDQYDVVGGTRVAVWRKVSHRWDGPDHILQALILYISFHMLVSLDSKGRVDEHCRRAHAHRPIFLQALTGLLFNTCYKIATVFCSFWFLLLFQPSTDTTLSLLVLRKIQSRQHKCAFKSHKGD